MADFCLTLICPSAIDEKLLDTLLEGAGRAVFTSTPTFSHGMAASRLSAHEQVMGRSRATQIQLLIDAAECDALVEGLRTQFAGTGLRFWLTAIAGQGELR